MKAVIAKTLSSLNPGGLSQRSLLIAAFAAIYVIWGSTYLAISLAARTLPGLSMIGVRFLLAGAILFAWARWRGAPRPTAAHWWAGTVTGGLMLCGGTGGVVVAVRHLDSGLVALLVGTVPLWIALLGWLVPGGGRPSLQVVAALAVGFVGVAVLAAPGEALGGDPIHRGGLAVILLACLLWSIGSLYSRSAALPKSSHLTSALQMITGGVLLLVWGAAAGDWRHFEPEAASLLSVLAFFYLVIFGSLVAFSAYSWLIRTAEPTQVATYAYVNPVVAVFLGWLFNDETVGAKTLVAAVLILGSVVLVTTVNARRNRRSGTGGAPVIPAPRPPGDAEAGAEKSDVEVAAAEKPARLERCA